MKQRKQHFSIRALLIIFIFIFAFATAVVYSQDYDNVTVKKIQKSLKELGYDPGAIDGIWGKRTVDTVKKFQLDNKLQETGWLDYQTLKVLGLEGIKGSISVIQIEKEIKNALNDTWEIRKVELKNRIITVTPNFNYIKERGYTSMLTWVCMEICKYGYVVAQLQEIRILNTSQDQGWVFKEPNKCDQIIHAPLNKVDELIISKSREFDPYENRREQVAVNAKMHLRSEPTTLTYDDVKRMLVQYNFYSNCDKWSKGACNPKGNFQNDFVDNGNGTITDRTTGLMWQKDSSHHMEGSDAQVYVDNLNRKRFLGFTDWRLPTIEELASLIESKKSSEGLHMAPLFSQKVESYWSSDKLEPNVLWCVNFYAGAVIPYFHKTWQNMVRAVR